MTPRGWAIALFCSLALNVLLAGIIATAYLQRSRDIASRMTVYSVPWASRVIGSEVRPQVERIYVKYQDAMAKKRQALMANYEAVNATLEAPQFESKKFSEALARLRTETVAAQATMHEAMTEFAGQLTPTQRERLATAVNEWVEHREQRALRRAREIEKRGIGRTPNQ